MENEQVTERYRLNRDVLVTGNEYDVRMVRDQEHGRPVHAVVTVPGVGSVIVPPTVVTKVEPPLPPEPPKWAVVYGSDGRVYQRMPGSWECHWAEIGVLQRWTWAALCEDYPEEGALVPMVAVEPVVLPWQHISYSGYTTTIEAVPDGTAPGVRVELEGNEPVLRRYNVNDARELARAILTAADEVERADQS